MKKNNFSWYVVMSKPNQESRAIKNLQNQNFDVFCPYFEKEYDSGNLTKIIKGYLFPSYIFIKLNIKSLNWLRIKNTFGVKKILSLGNFPSEIEKKFVDNLKLVSNDNGLLNESLFSYKPKQKVIITKGPFRKILGEVISLVGDKRIKILLNCMNDYKKIILEKKDILPN